MGDHIIYHLSQDLLRDKKNLSTFMSGHRNKPGHSHALSVKDYLRKYHRKMKISLKKRNGIQETEALT